MALSTEVLIQSSENHIHPRHRIKTVEFEMICELPDTDEELFESLVLPKVFVNKLEPKSTTMVLVDYLKREFVVEVDRIPTGYLLIHEKDWPEFVTLNLVGEDRIKVICLRLLRLNVFEIFCFNENGHELCRSDDGLILMKRCVVPCKQSTYYKQLIPSKLLEDLNTVSKRKPTGYAEISGPRHVSKVEVVYHYDDSNPPLRKWRAVGFEGSQWTLFLMENSVEANSTLMISNLRNGCFQVSVFNTMGLSVSSTCFKEDSLVDYIKGSSDYSDESDGDSSHQCSIVGHRHRSMEFSFTLKLPELILTRKFLTVPAGFVETHRLYLYKEAKLFYGNLRFKTILERRLDQRRPNDLSHVVMKGKWEKFLQDSGLVVGDSVRFELKLGRSVLNGAAVFRIC